MHVAYVISFPPSKPLYVYSSNPHIICVPETWLKPFIFNEILPINYVVYRNDCDGRGGGVLLAVKSKISSKFINPPSHLDLLTVSISYGKTFIINLL